MSTFEQVLEQVSALPLEQQEILLKITQRRLDEQRRKALVSETQAALQEFQENSFTALTAAEAITEIDRLLKLN